MSRTKSAGLRKATGFTQEQLADALGISRLRIAYYESEAFEQRASSR